MRILLEFFLPGLIMLVCLVRPFRQFLLSVSFTLFQDFPFSCHGSLIVFILEEPWRKEEQIFAIRCGSEINPVNVVSRSIHFALEHRSNSYLILQNRLALFAFKNRMSALSCTTFQHQQSVLVRFFQQQLGSLGECLRLIHIKSESTAWQFHSLHHALRIMAGVVKLHQSPFRSIVSGTSQTKIRLLLIASTQLLILLFRGDGAGNLVPVLHLN